MLLNNRVIWKDASTLKDLSIELNDLFAGTKTIDIVASADKLYLGSDLPFNHRYFQVSSANAIASTVSAEIWNGSEWVSAVDVLDLTKDSNGATLSQSGIIQWTLERNSSFGLEETTENIPELSTLRIYDMYWVRLTFSADLTPTTALSYVGHKFSSDAYFGGLGYPDLNRSAVKTAHTSGKTDWNEQHVLASEILIRDLRKKQVITSGSQILGWDLFSEACAHKAAELIFTAFGEKKEQERELAGEKYEAALNQVSFPSIDKNQDGRVDQYERVPLTTVPWRRR